MADFVLLCYPHNTPYSYDAHTPLSVLALGTYLEQRGIAVEYFDERIDPHRRFRELLDARPLLVGFSVIGGYQLASAERLSRIARSRSPGSLIVWGGVAPTTLADEIARQDFVDCVVIGEGEETLLELFESRRKDPARDVSLIAGVAAKKDGAVRRGPPRTPPDVEALPFVYQGKAVEMLRRYLLLGSVREVAGFEASRGCPFRCTFCYSPRFHGQARLKSPGKVSAELEALGRLGVRDLDIYDDTLFGGRREAFPAYLELLRRSKIRWIGNLRISMLTEPLLRLLEESGCRWLYFGIESDDDRVLRAIKKGFAARDIRDGLALMRRSALPVVYSIIYGLPLEGEADKVGHCLDMAEELHRAQPEAEIQVQSFVPLPGSELYPAALDFGFKPPKDLAGWVRHDHFGVSNPWLPDPSLANKIYLSSFLAFRYRRHLSRFPLSLAAYPLHRLSLWRIRRRFFRFYFEKILYSAFLAVSELRVRILLTARDLWADLCAG